MINMTLSKNGAMPLPPRGFRNASSKVMCLSSNHHGRLCHLNGVLWNGAMLMHPAGKSAFITKSKTKRTYQISINLFSAEVSDSRTFVSAFSFPHCFFITHNCIIYSDTRIMRLDWRRYRETNRYLDPGAQHDPEPGSRGPAGRVGLHRRRSQLRTPRHRPLGQKRRKYLGGKVLETLK